MPLTFTDQPPIERGMSAGFMVVMSDGARDVPVVVAHEALGAFLPGAPDPMQSLGERRGAIEAAATAKYERGDIARNGHVMITAHDLG